MDEVEREKNAVNSPNDILENYKQYFAKNDKEERIVVPQTEYVEAGNGVWGYTEAELKEMAAAKNRKDPIDAFNETADEIVGSADPVDMVDAVINGGKAYVEEAVNANKYLSSMNNIGINKIDLEEVNLDKVLEMGGDAASYAKDIAGLSKALKAGGVAVNIVSYGLDALDIINTGTQYGFTSEKTVRKIFDTVGSASGAAMGSSIGSTIGAAIGSAAFPLVGTFIGGLLGGLIGGYIGGSIGQSAGDAVGDLIY